MQPGVQSRLRSLGMKLFVVCGLGLLMMIPAFFVEDLIQDRHKRAEQVVGEISAHVGGQQTFLGPTLAIPYLRPNSGNELVSRGVYLVFPTRAVAELKVSTKERVRSLFKVPVFETDAKFDAAFDLTSVPYALPPGVELDWSRAEIVVGVSDARGALADAKLTVGSKSSTFVPAAVAPTLCLGGEQAGPRLALLGSALQEITKAGTQFSVSSNLRFSGAQRLAVLAYGKTTQVRMEGDWPSPGFDGGFLPVTRTISPHGFSADWSIPFIARGVRAEGQSEAITGLEGTALGLTFVEVADPYQSVDRALKYLPLFLGLVFLTHFVLEASSEKRVHPSQYVLIGMAQLIFYLLLLSLAERVGFDVGFCCASIATVTLLAANASWIFASRREGLTALITFSLLYVLIFVLLRLEDNALLAGAIASFLAVAAAMYFTRGLDWDSSLPATLVARQTASAPRSAE
ncbi:MAG: cell envelope integrity protein CreD [Acidobacteria bacterium]|nr:cell envelope integrity protein CreD [Acidobacteriota bacterium]